MIKNVHGQEATDLLNDVQTFVLDVRTPEEFRTGALKNAKLIPVQQLDRKISELPHDKKVTILIYCAHGVRSVHGAHILEKHGYENIFNLMGGIVTYLHENR